MTSYGDSFGFSISSKDIYVLLSFCRICYVLHLDWILFHCEVGFSPCVYGSLFYWTSLRWVWSLKLFLILDRLVFSCGFSHEMIVCFFVLPEIFMSLCRFLGFVMFCIWNGDSKLWKNCVSLWICFFVCSDNSLFYGSYKTCFTLLILHLLA